MTQRVDEIREAIRLLLEIKTDRYSEYEIIRILNEQGWCLSLDASQAAVLFQSHFLVYHALYQLQEEYWHQESRFLDVSALSIGFVSDNYQDPHQYKNATSMPSHERASSYQSHQSLRDYYLDFSHFTEATDESVESLLNQFWTRYIASDEQSEALAVLTLEQGASLPQVKRRYRELAMAHHPDRGGEVAVFQRVNWAFGVLQHTF